jgi:hypothetical protein
MRADLGDYEPLELRLRKAACRSVHSDYWTGTAAELANRDAIAVFPVGGWWKEKATLMRYDRIARYALVVSIRAISGSVNIYTPIEERDCDNYSH